jgi:hypothetical protein
VIETPYRDIRGRPQKSSFRTKIQRAIAVLQVARLTLIFLIVPVLGVAANAQQPAPPPAQSPVELVLPADVPLQDQQKISGDYE